MKKILSILIIGLMMFTGFAVSTQHESTASATEVFVKNMQPQTSFMNNSPPSTPVINGPATGKYNVGYNFTFTSTDPDNDNVYYWIEWGDGCPSVGWLGPYPSGQTITVSHIFPRGTWTVSCQAKDIYNATSGWGNLTVTMALSSNLPSNGFLEWLFARFPYAFPILRSLLGY
jgi:hypothetical protein